MDLPPYARIYSPFVPFLKSSFDGTAGPLEFFEVQQPSDMPVQSN